MKTINARGATRGRNFGGRNYRLNWGPPAADGSFMFGSYAITNAYPGTRHPWLVSWKGSPMTRSHGACTGQQRFGSAENAQRWVERRVAKRGAA